MAGELRATVLTTVKGEAVKKLQKDLEGIGGSLNKLGGIVGKVAKGFAGFATAIGATKFISASIEQAKLLEQTYRSLEVVFGPLSGEMEKFAASATKIGLSQTEAAKASIFIGNVLQQYGISTEDAAQKTQKLVGLAADLAFVTGYDVQEALLGMTALFRGEYDPIEKFGVAMKQNEIESIKLERGLHKLTGQAELHADVLIREELLLQRTAKSMGAFTNNSDSLAVQSEVLRATFENLQATIGQELSPVITQFYSDLIPIVEDAAPGLIRVFEIVAEVIKELAATFIEIFDPTTKLGGSVAALIVQFDELGKTIFGKDFAFIGGVFDVARYFVDLFVRALTDVLYMIQSIVVELQAWGKYVNAILTGDWDTVARGIQGVSRELHAAKDAAIAAGNAMAKFMQAEQVASEFASLPDVWNLAGSGAKDAGVQAGIDYGKGVGEGAKQGAKNPIKEFWAGLQADIEKQAARMKLEGMGATTGLIDAILGSGSDWKKVFDNIVEGGMKGLQKAQAMFNKTAAGIKEITDASQRAHDELVRMSNAAAERAQGGGGGGNPIEADAPYFPGSPNYFQSMGINMFGEAFYGRERYFQQYGANESAQAYWDTLKATEGDVYAALTEQAKVYYQFQDEVYRQFQQKRSAQSANFERNVQEAFAIFGDPKTQTNLNGYIDAVTDLRTTLVEAINANPFVEPGQYQYALGLFTEKNQKKLIKSITETTDLMITVAQARLDLIPKLEQAQSELDRITGERTSLFGQMVNSVMGGVDITRLGTSSSAITKALSKTLAQAKTFAANLVTLRNQGLDPTLLQQLISAGVDAGNTTAQALLKGGPQAVEQINSIYSQIEAVATEIGDTGADAFFESGISAAQSLVDGLLAEQELLAEAATGLAKMFAETFSKNIDDAMVSMYRGSLEAYIQAINDPSIPWDSVVNPFFPSYRTKENANIYTININPGLVSDPAALGREVVNAIQRYEQNNGRVFRRAGE